MIAEIRKIPLSKRSVGNPWNHNLIQKLIALFLKAYPAVTFLALSSLIIINLRENALSPLFFAFFLAILGVLICKIFFKKEYPKAKRIFLTVFCLSILLTIIIYKDLIYHYGYPYEGEGDDKHYEEYAYAAIDSGSIGYASALLYFRRQGHSDSSFYYTSFVATLHGITRSLGMSSHTLNPRFVNSFFLAFIAIISWRFGVLLGLSNRGSQLAGYLAGCWPLLVYHSAIIRRDTIFAFFILLSVYLYVSFLKNRSKIKLSKIILLACSVIIVSLLRYGFWAIYFFLFSAIFVFSFWTGLDKRNYLVKMCSMLLLIGVGSFVIISSSLFHRNVYGSIAQMMTQYSSYVTRRASYSERGIGSSVFKLPTIISIPTRLAYASVTPPPIPTTFLTYNIRWIGTIFWFLCLPVLIRSIFYAIMSRGREFIALKALASSFVVYYVVINLISFTETQQMMYFPFGILLILYGLERQTRFLRSSASSMILLGVLLTVCYVVLKSVL